MTEPKINLRDGIGIALISAFVGSAFVLFWKEIPRSNEQLISYILGQLSGFVSAIVAFHYVTKAGEKELDAQRAVNTEKAFDAIKAASEATPPGPIEATIVNEPENPVPVEDKQ